MKKIGLARRGRFSSNWMKAAELLAILLNAGGAQAGEAMLVDRELPGEELIDCKGITAAGLFEREQAATDGGDDLGLTANDPPFRPWRG
jgi:hypothetical protein